MELKCVGCKNFFEDKEKCGGLSILGLGECPVCIEFFLNEGLMHLYFEKNLDGYY